MKTISRQSKANQVVKHWHWHHQYQAPHRHFDHEVIEKRLIALGHRPDPDQVDQIIGNDHWTRCSCDECGASVEVAIEFQGGDDHDLIICPQCLIKALQELTLYHPTPKNDTSAIEHLKRLNDTPEQYMETHLYDNSKPYGNHKGLEESANEYRHYEWFVYRNDDLIASGTSDTCENAQQALQERLKDPSYRYEIYKREFRLIFSSEPA